MTTISNNTYFVPVPHYEKISAPPESKESIQKVALGILTVIPLPAISMYISGKIYEIFTKFKIEVTSTQDVYQIWDSLGGVYPNFLSLALKTAFLGFVVIIGPVWEEFLFRECLFIDFDGPLGKMISITGNGFIFGLYHLSPFQGWANIPIFFATFALGVIFAAQRSATGDITASATTHILYNGFCMYKLLTGV